MSGAASQSPATKQDPANIPGEWVTPAVSYVDPVRRFCALCGRPIARRYWRVTTESGQRVYCEPAHAALYTTYPMSTTHRTPGNQDDEA